MKSGGKNMINFKRIAYQMIVVVLILNLFSLAGCGGVPQTSVGNSGAGKQQPLVKLKVGYPNGSLVRELFLQTAIDKGFFAKYGLEIDGKGYNVGGQIIQDLAGGNLDVGIVGPSASLAGAAQGVDLKIVASIAKNDCPLVVRQGINSIKDLNGKKVGTPGVSSIQETMLNYLESQQGIKTTHSYANGADLVAYLEKGEIDAIVAWEPIAAQSVSKLGAHYLLDTILPNAEAADMTVTGKLFRENPEVAVRLLKAAQDTQRYIIANTAERVAIAAHLTGLSESVISESVRRSSLFVAPMQLNMDSIKLITSQDITAGKLRGVDPKGLDAFLTKNIDTTLLEKALNN